MGLFRLAYKNIIQRKSRFILTTLSVVIGVTFVVGVFLLTGGLRATFNTLADDIIGDSDLTVRAQQEFGNRDDNSPSLPGSIGPVLETVEGVQRVAPGIGDLGVILEDSRGFRIDSGGFQPEIGINWDEQDTDETLFLVSSFGNGSGKIPAGMDEFAVDIDTAIDNDMRLGDEYVVSVSSGKYAGDQTVKLTGVFNFAEEDNNATMGAVLIAFDSQTASNFFNDGLGFDQYDIFLELTADPQQVEADIIAAIQASPEVSADLQEARVMAEVVNTEEAGEEISNMFNSAVDGIRNVLLGFAFIILLVSTFVIYNTFSIILDQRIKELGLLRALGINGTQIQRLILGEALVVGLFATAIGFGLGIVAFFSMIAILSALAGGTLPSIPLDIGPTSIIAAVAVGVGITLVSALAPSAKSRRIPPIAAIREGSSSLLQIETKIRPILGSAIMSAGVILAVVAVRSSWILLAVFSLLAVLAFYLGGTRINKSIGQLSVFAFGVVWLLLAAVIDLNGGEAFTLFGMGAIIVFIGVNLVSPIFGARAARILGYPFKKMFGIVGHLGVENSARNPKRTTTTSSALMIGLALVATSAVLVSSLQASFSDALSNAVRADWIICREDCTAVDSSNTFSTAVAEDIDKQDESISALGYRYLDNGIRVNGVIEANTVTAKGDVFSVFGTKLNIVSQHMDLDFDEVAPDVSGVNSVFVHDDRADAYNLSIGSQVQVEFLSGQVETVRVVGIYRENRVLFSDWILTQELIDEHTQGKRDIFVTVVANPNFSEDELRDAFTDTASRTLPGAQVSTSDEFNDAQTEQIALILIIITFFLGLSFIVAILGVANTLSLSIFERVREIGLLRAVGQKRSQVWRMVVVEGLVVAFFGCIFGIGLGVLFGVIGVIVIPDSFISIISFRPAWLIGYAIAGAVAGFISTIVPAIRAGRLNILRAIASE